MGTYVRRRKQAGSARPHSAISSMCSPPGIATGIMLAMCVEWSVHLQQQSCPGMRLPPLLRGWLWRYRYVDTPSS